MRALRLLLATGAVVLALGACSSDTKVVETKDGKVTVEGKGKKAPVSITAEDGTKLTFNQHGIPGDFPDSVPRPAGAKLRTAASGTRAGTQYFQLTYGLGDASAADAVDAYRKRLEAAGFTVDKGSDVGGAQTLEADQNDWHLVILATGTGASGTMSVSVTGG